MLPTGHIAAGLLTTQAALKIFKPEISGIEAQQLLWWGVFWSFAPDLDTFWAFFKAKSFYYNKKDNSVHRRFYTHIPLLWLIVGLVIFILSPTAYWKTFGLILWAGSFSHFLLDSIEYGVMWLWPFNKELWAFKNRGIKVQINSSSFWGFWITFLKFYITRVTFIFEIVIIISALILNLNFFNL